MPPDQHDLTEVKVALARISAGFDNLVSTVQSVDKKMDTFVPRREADQTEKAIHERLSKLEKAQEKAVWAIVLSWITGVGAVIFKKTGLIP